MIYRPTFSLVAETGGLFGLAVKLMQLFSDNKMDMSPLMAILGLYFQIRDDYANLHMKEVCINMLTEIESGT